MKNSLKIVAALALIAVFTSGCLCKAVSTNQWAGHKSPKMTKPEDIASNLRRTVNGAVGPVPRTVGFFTTPFKRVGIFGWKDLGYDGEVTALVKQAAKSSDQFLTVDMRLETLKIDRRDMPLDGERFLRAEVCLCEVRLAENERPQPGEKIWMRGRMMWDGDGFIEIHPRSAEEVRRGGEAKAK